MSYAGNPSLPSDVQQRILETFRHTLDVAARGSLEEARLGCDFVLQLDSQFKLAQVLSERLRGASGPVEVDDIRAQLDGAPAAAPAAAPARPAAAPAAAPAAPRPAAPAPPRPAAADLHRELAQLLAERDFVGLMSRAAHDHVAIAASPDLQHLLAQAQELMEAAPYVDRFLAKARQAIAAGRAEEARAALDKARALDAGHPGLVELGRQLSATPAPPPPAFAPDIDEPLVSEPGPLTASGSTY